ncbi:DNA binding protein [Aureococcus anophagefferens]|nr:DNA binding protein [Aureococcus anophagefferens]
MMRRVLLPLTLALVTGLAPTRRSTARRQHTALFVLDDAFEMAAAEALKDEMAAKMQQRKGAERVAVLAAADALEEAQTLEDLERALDVAGLAGVRRRVEFAGAVARRKKLLDALAREAVLETLAGASVSTADELALIGTALEEAAALGLSLNDPVVFDAATACRAYAASADVDGAAATAAALIFKDEAHALYDDFSAAEGRPQADRARP